MKLMHVADLHVGKRVNGVSMLDDQRYIFSQMLEIIRDEGVDALLIAGDIYDKATPSAEAVTVFDAFLTELVSLGVAVIAIPGNHDSAERVAYAQGLLGAQRVYFPPVYNGEVTCIRLTDAHGPVNFWLLPFLKPGDVRRYYPEANIADDYTTALMTALRTCSLDKTQRNVILSHQLVTAFGVSPERADDEIKLGGLDNVDFSAYDSFDYVALGHVHRPQRVGRDSVRYAGSPLKYSFSEARYDKSCVLVELGAKAPGDPVGACATIRLVALKPMHDMRELTMSLADVVRCGTDDSASQDYVHITLTDQHPQLDAMAKVRDVYPNAMALDYEFASALVARDDSRETVNPDSMSMADMFASFYEAQTGSPLSDGQAQLVSELVCGIEEAEAK